MLQRSSRTSCICLLVAIFISIICDHTDARLELTYMNGTETIVKTYFSAPIRFLANNYEFSVSSSVWAFNANSIESAANVLVVIPYVKKFTPFWEPVLALQDAAAVGVIMEHPYFPVVPGALMYYEYDDGVVSDRLTLPIVELGGADFADVQAILSFVKETNQTLFGVIDSADPNPWEVVYNSGWMLAFTIIFAILSALTFSLALKELLTFIKKEGGLRWTIPQVCLISIAFGSLWRVLYAVVTPFLMRRIWDSSLDDAFASTSFPFSICPVFLVSLYQHELLLKRVATKMNGFLTKMKLPFFITVGVVFAIDISFSIIRGLGIGVQLVMLINIAVYVLIGLVFFFYFFITSLRVISVMKRMRENAAISSAYKIIRRLTIWMILSSLSILYFSISVALLLVPAFMAPLEWTIVWFNVLLSLYLISLSHIGLYMMRNNKQFSNSNMSKSKQVMETSAASTNVVTTR